MSNNDITTDLTLHELQHLIRAFVANSSPSVIPQQLLDAYRSLGIAYSLRSPLRRHLIQLHDAGVPVEFGAQNLRIEESVIRRFTLGGLAELVGQIEAESLRNRLRPVTSRKLIVESTQNQELDSCLWRL